VDTDLENLPDQDLSNYTSKILDSMQYTSFAEALWTATPPTSGAKLEFRKLYQEFWYNLGLSILDSTNTSGEEEDDDSDSDDEEEDETKDDNTFRKNKKGATSPRFQVEAARMLINRLLELCFLHQVELRSAFTTALYSVATAILHKTVEFQDTSKIAERQYQAAKRNKQSRKAEALKVQVDTVKRMLGDLEEIVQTSVGAVFMNRYKDVNPHIRAATMMAMADWCAVRPDIYFDRKLLKYAAWTLNDKVPVVREAAITALLRPMKSNVDEIASMGGLIEKMAPRLADCTIDVDEKVQERAMELLLVLSRTGILDAIEDQGFWNQINMRAIDPMTTPKVRILALLFVIEQLGSFDNDNLHSGSNSVECLSELAGWVAHTLGQSEIPLDQMRFEYSAYIIQSLRACPEHEALARDFPSLIKAFENSLSAGVSKPSLKEARENQALADMKQRVLLFFLMTAVEEEVSLSDPEQLMDFHLEEPETSHRNKSSVRDSMTRALLPTLPNLVTSFKGDNEVLRRLVKLPLYFGKYILSLGDGCNTLDRRIFSFYFSWFTFSAPTACGTSDQKQNAKKVLKTLSDCFMMSSDHVVLQNCCHSLSFLATADHARQDEAMAELRSIFNSTRKRLSDLVEKKRHFSAPNKDDNDDDDDEAMEDHQESDESSLEKVDYSISLLLRRLAVLAKRWPLLDLLGEGDNDDNATVDRLCAEILRLAKFELDIRKPFAEDDKNPIAKIWENGNTSHEYVADTIQASLDILLSTAAWTFRKVTAELESLPEGTDENDGQANSLLVVRQRVDVILSLCFEQYYEDPDSLSPEHREFSDKVQEIAGRAAGDLRVLFPRALNNSVHRILREAALVDDSHLIGGFVRFIRQQRGKVRFYTIYVLARLWFCASPT
jgi:cohesin complex subunit SA-1/2